MRGPILPFILLASFAATVPLREAGAVTIFSINGTTASVEDLPDGTVLDGSLPGLQSGFNQGITSNNPGTSTTTGTFTIGDIPVFTDIFHSTFPPASVPPPESRPNQSGYFEFLFDVQQTRRNILSVSDITISLGSLELWRYDANGANSPYTPIELELDQNANSADLGLYIPVEQFVNAASANGITLTGASVINFTWTQANDDSGRDEWTTRSCAEAAGSANFRTCFGLETPVSVVPLPPAAFLMLSGLAALGGLRLSRRTTA